MLVSLSEFKKYAKKTDQDEDPQMYDCLVYAHAQANLITDRTLELTKYGVEEGDDLPPEFQSGSWQSEIRLRNYPIVSIEEINDDSDLSFGESTVIAESEYQINKDFGTVNLASFLFTKSINGENNVRISYTAGYTSSNAPLPLKLGILKLALGEYLEHGAFLNSVTQNDEGSNKSEELKKAATELLITYKRY